MTVSQILTVEKNKIDDKDSIVTSNIEEEIENQYQMEILGLHITEMYLTPGED